MEEYVCQGFRCKDILWIVALLHFLNTSNVYVSLFSITLSPSPCLTSYIFHNLRSRNHATFSRPPSSLLLLQPVLCAEPLPVSTQPTVICPSFLQAVCPTFSISACTLVHINVSGGERKSADFLHYKCIFSSPSSSRPSICYFFLIYTHSQNLQCLFLKFSTLLRSSPPPLFSA